jgi:2-dehydropantoate 2-reductase
MAHVAIVGVGAIGGALAGLLKTAGNHKITLCTRRPLNALTVHTPEGEVHLKAQNATDPKSVEPVDWVLIATKTYDAEGAAAWLPALCAKHAPVAIVQNGVEHRERFAPWVDEHFLLPVVIDCPVERKSDGAVYVRGGTLMKVEDAPLGREFVSLFSATTAKVQLVENFATAAWWKLCINSVGALNALTLKPAGVLWGESMSRLAREMVAECAAVGRAEGAQLDDDIADQVMNLYRAHPADAVNSLLADRLAGRKMEIDARNGAIVRKGEKHGIPTPLNRMTVTLLNAM